MDTLCLKAGIQGMASPFSVTAGLEVRNNAPTHIATAVGRSSSSSVSNSISVEKPAPSPWGFSFKHSLRSLWPGAKSRFDAIAVDDAVLVEENEEKRDSAIAGAGNEAEDGDGKNGSWVLKILHVGSLWKEEGKQNHIAGTGINKSEEEDQEQEQDQNEGRRRGECGGGDEECDVCTAAGYDYDDGNKIQFDRDSFSKLLRRVSLREARLYAQMSYLGNLAYSISQIKPGNLLKNHGLRFVTSSLEKKEQALRAEAEEKASSEIREVEVETEEPVDGRVQRTSANPISASTAYQITASAASYLHNHTKSILPFKASNGKVSEDSSSEGDGSKIENVDMMNAEVASLMATTDSVTAVVAAKEEVKQAVADDLKSTHSSPCEWFICDDEKSCTRFFVIQGSESLASWQANLLFEPIQFEGLDVLVHRGIYEAAKGIYEQMLPDVRGHVQCHGDHACFRFTGHSLGGSLSLLINLMLLIRSEVPSHSLLPVITFGSPSIMCGGDRLLHTLGLPRSHVQAIMMHRDIVPRAFSCTYPNHVAELLKAVNGKFRNHPCLNNQRLLYAPMGEFLILQPDEKFSPHHHLLPSGSGLYLMSRAATDDSEADKEIQAAQSVFLNSPHPLEILSDRSAYGSGGTIQRDHDMNSYLKSVRTVIRQELNLIRKARREHRRRVWWPLVAAQSGDVGIVVRQPVATGNKAHSQLNFAGMLETGRDSLKRFNRLIASQHMHLLVLLLFPARVLIVEAYSIIRIG